MKILYADAFHKSIFWLLENDIVYNLGNNPIKPSDILFGADIFKNDKEILQYD